MDRCWLLVLLLAGCASPGVDEASFPLEIFVFDTGLTTFLSDQHGVMARIHNPTDQTVAYTVAAPTMAAGRLGRVDGGGWHPIEATGTEAGGATAADTLAPGASRLWLAQFEGFTVSFEAKLEVVTGEAVLTWSELLMSPQQDAVDADMHVLTHTVGVWVNGTSFYTNIAALHGDPAFPRGYAAEAFDAAPLPVYVYDVDRTEQPARSRDTCHFTTIDGYNALLKTQAARGTGVRFLAPEEAYTRPGAEQHFLYGEPLAFLNHVVAIEARDARLDDVPDPQGACFDAERYVPPVRALAPFG